MLFSSQVEEILQNIDGASSEYNITIAHDNEKNKDIMIVTVELEGRVNFETTSKMIQGAFKSKIGVTPRITPVPVGTLPRSEKKTKRVTDYREN